jgi:hypothetical protein
MPGTWPTNEYQEPPDDAFPPEEPPVAVPAAALASTVETLNLLDEFFRLHASTATRAPNCESSPATKAGTPSKAPRASSTASASTRSAWAGHATRRAPSPTTTQPNRPSWTGSSGDATADHEHRPATSTRNRPRP